MTQVAGAFPYDLANLLGGRARLLYAPIDESIATNLLDIIDLVHPYAPNGDWVDLGSAVDSSSYSRDMESEGYEIQQVSGLVFEEITEVARSLNVDIAEIEPNNVHIIEEATTTNNITAGALKSAQKEVPIGSFSETTQRRWALIAQRQKGSGIVTEPTTLRERGRFVCIHLFRASLAADETEMEFEKGSLVHAPVQLNCFPEGGEDSGEEIGRYFFEDAGTIAAT